GHAGRWDTQHVLDRRPIWVITAEPERDDFSSNRHPALAFWWSMIFSENRYPPRIKSGAGFFEIILLARRRPGRIRHEGRGSVAAAAIFLVSGSPQSRARGQCRQQLRWQRAWEDWARSPAGPV